MDCISGLDDADWDDLMRLARGSAVLAFHRFRWSNVDLDDLVSEACVIILMELPKYVPLDGGGSRDGFLAQRVKWRLFDYYRSLALRERRTVALDESLADSIPDPNGVDFDAGMIYEEAFAQIVASLPDTKHLHAIVRYRAAGLTMKETAERLGIHESRVSQILTQFSKASKAA